MIKIFKNLTKKDLIIMSLISILIIFQVWLDLQLPDYMSNITRLVQTQNSQMKDILNNGLMMLLCAFGSLIGAILTGLCTATLSSNVSMNLRKKLFSKVESLDMNDVKKFSTSSLITRTTNDITHVQMFIAMGLQMLIKAPLTAFMAIIKILNKSWQWSALVAVCVLILLSVIITLIIIVMPRFKIVQKLIDKLNQVTRENLSGIRVIRAFNAESYQEDKFEDINNKLTNQQLFNQKTFAIMQPVMYLIMHGLTLGIYFIGANLINEAGLNNKITLFGDMIVFSSYGMQIISSFLMLAMIFMILPRADVSAKRVNEVIDTSINIINGKVKKSKQQGTIEFKDVSFKYPDGDQMLLRNISFKIEKGKTFAIIGSTGSGKSTLINLIPRLYDVTEGEVLVNGINAKEYDKEYLNKIIGFVTQKPILFKGSIKSNVSYGSKANLNKVKEAIKVAQAKDFVEKLEDKYDSYVAPLGTNFSGGQKQRLAIARAIAKDPQIYIFDDSFSALDYKTDSKLRKELKKYTKDVTTIIVAQRIGTIMNADEILVLDEGKVVGLGKHQDLLKNCEVYKQIALSQLSKEELDNA